ncbi:MAG: glycosyltransferase family 4 protein [Candidatus Accumulibacter propinquus]|jgi:glycosyltransferase involved in cell wall biosynthesis
MKNILINAANLHSGGGVQVAASFIEELVHILPTCPDMNWRFSVLVSTEVLNNLPTEISHSRYLAEFRVLDVYGLSVLKRNCRASYRGFDVCFTLFGPMYLNLKSCYKICGFAQPWIIYPDNAVYSLLSFRGRLQNRVKFFIQRLFFQKNDRLVVELAHVRERLSSLGIFDEGSVDIVENCVASVYLNPSRWLTINFDYRKLRNCTITLGFLGRGYAHKNLGILRTVGAILSGEYGLVCNFLFTLEQQEMTSLGFDSVEGFYSVGTISSAQCPDFYMNIDALLFPSLLECFSATPIEAMVMKRPVLASDRAFVRDVCGDYAYYFDPLDARDIARVIVDAFSDKQRLAFKVGAAYQHVLGLPTAKDRAEKYLGVIRKSLLALK